MEIVGPGQGRGRRGLGRAARARRPRLGGRQRGADRRDRSGEPRLLHGLGQRRQLRRASTATGTPTSGEPFRFYEAYNPDGRFSFASTRREWRVLDLLAPSLELHANGNVFPFSVKPEKPVGPEKIMELFRDTYEGTDFDMVKDLTVTDEEGKTVKSPLANPFMPYDMNKLLQDQRRLGLARASGRWPAGTACTSP